MNGGSQGMVLLLTFVLASMLGPAAFGTITMALIYTLLLQTFADHTFGAAIVQRRDLLADHLDAAFWILLAGSLLIAGIGFALSGWWAQLNRLPELEGVIDWLLPMIPLQAAAMVHDALLQRALDFRALALRSNLSVVVGGGVGLWLAFSGHGVWSLVAQQLAASATRCVILWRVCPWRPRWRFRVDSARDLWGFSSGNLLGALGDFVEARSDALLMGIFFGPRAVGIYRLAQRFVSVFVDISAQSVQAVAFPQFSRFQDDPTRLLESVVRCVRTSAYLVLPPVAFLALLSGELTALLGPEWSDATASIAILCIAGAVRGVTLFIGPLLHSMGRAYALAGLIWAYGILGTLGFLAVGVLLTGADTWEQAAGISASRAGLYALVFLPLNLMIARRLLPLSRTDIAAALAPAAVATAAGALALTAVRSSGLLEALPLEVRAVGLAAAGAAVALALLWLQDPALRRALRLAGPGSRRSDG